GLADDQLGYLISPINYVPIIAAEAGVNDNIIFNVSPTIGDHVMCSDIALAVRLGFQETPLDSPGKAAPSTGDRRDTCAAYDKLDEQGDPLGDVPVGGVSVPDLPPAP
ncbi:MAG: hypothetical protein M3290_11215, partial [Actinomycetota bacterium]|nr:hypothetical protein [Actinomycetota bacterium]